MHLMRGKDVAVTTRITIKIHLLLIVSRAKKISISLVKRKDAFLMVKNLNQNFNQFKIFLSLVARRYVSLLYFILKYQDCAWLIPTEQDDVLKCKDGTFCNWISHGYSCCNEHGGRAKCPQNHPDMCADKECADDTDYCCSSVKCTNGTRICSMYRLLYSLILDYYSKYIITTFSWIQ